MPPGWHLSDLFTVVMERLRTDLISENAGRPCLNEYLTVRRAWLRNAEARLFTFCFELACLWTFSHSLSHVGFCFTHRVMNKPTQGSLHSGGLIIHTTVLWRLRIKEICLTHHHSIFYCCFLHTSIIQYKNKSKVFICVVLICVFAFVCVCVLLVVVGID